MIISVTLLIAASIIASGVLFRHKRLLTFLAAAGVIFEGQWLLITVIDRTVLQGSDSGTVYLIGSIVLAVVWALFAKSWSLPYREPGSGIRDLYIIPVIIIALSASCLIFQFNGMQGSSWIFHGFFNGDTATFASLVQRSLHTTGLVNENPFAGNGSLEYPTLLHAGVASLLQDNAQGTGLLHLLPIMTYLQILITVPLLYLLIDIVYPEPSSPHKKWLGVPSRPWVHALTALLVFYVLGLSWDNFVYPQSHFFLTGLFLLLAALLATGYSKSGASQLLHIIPACAIAFILLFSNAVTGTAATAAIIIFHLLRAQDKQYPVMERSAYFFTIAIWVVLFFLFTPGDGSFGSPGFSYTAAIDMLRLSVPIAALSLFFVKSESGPVILRSSFVALSGLALFAFFFSTRNIVVENAPRFFYHAILVAFPLAIPLLIQLFYWMRKELVYASRSVADAFTGWIAVGAAALIVLLPVGSSMASAHDNLMYKDEQVVDENTRFALWWIENNTEPNSVFIASPNEPFLIPMFTGRALLRSDYWLSPDDAVLADVKAAFAESIAAREQVISNADYLLLASDERSAWEPLPLVHEKVVDSGTVVIYKLK